MISVNLQQSLNHILQCNSNFTTYSTQVYWKNVPDNFLQNNVAYCVHHSSFKVKTDPICFVSETKPDNV